MLVVERIVELSRKSSEDKVRKVLSIAILCNAGLAES